MKPTEEPLDLGSTEISVNQGKLNFRMGDEIKPTWDDLRYVTKMLYIKGYVTQCKLLPHPNENLYPALYKKYLEEVFLSGTKETLHSLVPALVMNMERAVLDNLIDPYLPQNYGFTITSYVLQWYWFVYLGGPRPKAVKSIWDLYRATHRYIVQNEVLSCPLCLKHFVAPSNLVKQQPKMWAYIKWLVNHLMVYHLYQPPVAFKALVLKDVSSLYPKSVTKIERGIPAPGFGKTKQAKAFEKLWDKTHKGTKGEIQVLMAAWKNMSHDDKKTVGRNVVSWIEKRLLGTEDD